MKNEVAAAVVFLTKLVRVGCGQIIEEARAQQFSSILSTLFVERFRNHWYEEKPSRGQGYRCVNIRGYVIDPILEAALERCGIIYDTVNVPPDMTLWVDPGEVSCRFGFPQTSYHSLYKERFSETFLQDVQQITSGLSCLQPAKRCSPRQSPKKESSALILASTKRLKLPYTFADHAGVSSRDHSRGLASTSNEDEGGADHYNELLTNHESHAPRFVVPLCKRTRISPKSYFYRKKTIQRRIKTNQFSRTFNKYHWVNKAVAI